MHYVGKSICQFIPYYASAVHKHVHTRILKPFENSEPTGLKVDVAEISWAEHIFWCIFSPSFCNFFLSVTALLKKRKGVCFNNLCWFSCRHAEVPSAYEGQ